LGSRVILGEMLSQDACELDSVEDPCEQRQGTDFIGAEFEAIGPGTGAWNNIRFGAALRGGSGLKKGLGLRHGKIPPGWPEGNRRT
jgi:hypothetical protein